MGEARSVMTRVGGFPCETTVVTIEIHFVAPVHTIHYLHWAKTHPPARYELTVSGVPPVTADEFHPRAAPITLAIQGPYGHPDLVALIAERYGVAPAQVLPVTGTSTANLVALASCVERGQAIAVEHPTYEPLVRAVEFLGFRLLRFARDRSGHFAPHMAQVRHVLDEGARAIVLSDLHNPSGLLCPAEVMPQVAEACRKRSAALIVDEVYRDFASVNLGVARGTAAALGPHVVVTSSLTKVYGFGGVRAGWVIGSPAVIERARHVFNHLCVDLPAPSAHVAIRVLRDLAPFEQRTRAMYRHHYDVFSRWLKSRQDLTAYGNDGAVFAYLRLPAGFEADSFCAFLRQGYDTQVVSGSFFGDSDHIRVGFGQNPATLAEGLTRLGQALDGFPRCPARRQDR